MKQKYVYIYIYIYISIKFTQWNRNNPIQLKPITFSLPDLRPADTWRGRSHRFGVLVVVREMVHRVSKWLDFFFRVSEWLDFFFFRVSKWLDLILRQQHFPPYNHFFFDFWRFFCHIEKHRNSHRSNLIFFSVARKKETLFDCLSLKGLLLVFKFLCISMCPKKCKKWHFFGLETGIYIDMAEYIEIMLTWLTIPTMNYTYSSISMHCVISI